MYFTNIYKTLKQLERNRTKVKKTSRNDPLGSINKVDISISPAQFGSFMFQFKWLMFYKTRLA